MHAIAAIVLSRRYHARLAPLFLTVEIMKTPRFDRWTGVERASHRPSTCPFPAKAGIQLGDAGDGRCASLHLPSQLGPAYAGGVK